ncbi:hypothetical protein [uncultured Gulosibacter sp.]|uniref:hypothetical protein n=1 Tax=uncultured Gulosibacter sp. TaxID=1339167 RepID=UPI00288AD43A|nr:hypothetical protein [uncultured Gulosibacter sp.]
MAITLAEAKHESVRVQKSLVALIPAELRSEDKLPEPGTVKITPMACDNGLFSYPGGSAVRLIEGADGQAVAEIIERGLRELGWRETDIPTKSQPHRKQFRSADGYSAIISTIDRSDDLPMVIIDVWSPCAVPPAGFNKYSDKI